MTTKSKPRRKQGEPLPESAGPAAVAPRGRAQAKASRPRAVPEAARVPPASGASPPSPAKRAAAGQGTRKRSAARPTERRVRSGAEFDVEARLERAAEGSKGAVEGAEGAAEAAEAPAEAITPEVLAAQPDVLPPEPLDLDAGSAELTGNAELAGSAEGFTLPVPVGRDLAHADVLQRYLAEIARHPLLTREEEHQLAVRFQETREPRLAWRLVTANLRLVVKIANEYRRAAFNVLDLIQEGNVGLMQAVQKYDPFRGVKLSSYAAWWIRAYIIRYLMDNWRMVKLGTTQAQRKLFFNLRKEQEKMLRQGFEAQPKLLAERLDVSEQDVREMDQRLGNDEFSLDAPLSGGPEESRQTYGDRLGSGQQDPESALGEEELRRVFKEKLAQFGRTLTSEKDRFLFAHRISVSEGTEPLTLQQVGEKYGFTRERARQLEARLTDRLREFLREELPDFAQLSLTPSEEE